MLSLFFIVLGHAAYGTTNVLWKNPRQELGTLPLIILRSFFCSLIFLASYFSFDYFNIVSAKTFSSGILLKTIGICSINYFGLFFYLKSLKHTQVSNSIGFSKMGLIIGLLIGYFVYNEDVSTLKIFLCLLLITSVTIIEKAAGITKKSISKGFIYTFLSRMFWATGFLFIPFIKELGALLFCSILEITVCTMSILLLLFSKESFKFKKPSLQTSKEVFFLVVLGTTGTFCLNFSIVKTGVVVFAFLGLIEPILGLMISKIYLKEQLNRMQLIGIILGLISAFIFGLA